MRIRERRRRIRLSSRTNSAVALLGLAVAAGVLYVQAPPGTFGGNEESASRPFVDAPAGVEWVTATPAHDEGETGGFGHPFDLRDPAVLCELSGRDLNLTRNPIDQLPIDRGYDKTFLPQGQDQPETPGVTPDPEPVLDVLPSELPEETIATLSPEDREQFDQAKDFLAEGDNLWKSWRSITNDNERNRILEKGAEAYGAAVDLLRPLADHYPNIPAIGRTIKKALQGRHACKKHSTQ